ncbi:MULTISPECIES: N-acetyl sugar amidotransferase [unclassified Clostridium]|uniref:N-acetyl sugar amidotransferase n=1 Tax=unclassified Clostridium TaxID=2614128 RepID=UPI00029863A9|nr:MULTISPECIES: N-acetyl sugar amidotransferase [unclassified Clostridium]EKQ51109.1 MAG: N-acetyl sugar amidotransferase [Clostridium sp. Maddingley MBC34-26]
MSRKYQMCTRCVMDTTDQDIVFDSNGVCNNCKIGIKVFEEVKMKREGNANILNNIVEEIKKKGKNKKYDCIIGVSGGVDSSYVAYLVKQLGLSPLAVHLDNGWNSELAVENIRILLEKLNIDLYTYVINWEEFKNLQLAFLKASTPDSEIPTDHAIQSTLLKVAHKYDVKYIINGVNTTSESILPKTWSHGHQDWKYIKTINKLFGNKKLKTFPKYSFLDIFYFNNIYKIKNICILDYVDYNKNKAKSMLIEKYGWRDYGGKHYESVYTKFFQAYILPNKFNFDKRKAHLSSLISSNQISRDEALEELKEPLYDELALKDDMNYLVEKFGITEEQFEEIMKQECKYFWDYDSYEKSKTIKFIKRNFALMKNFITLKLDW